MMLGLYISACSNSQRTLHKIAVVTGSVVFSASRTKAEQVEQLCLCFHFPRG